MKAIKSILLLSLFTYSISATAQKESNMTSLNIQKTITIKADLPHVFDHIKYLEKFPEWSPFLEEDPTQTYKVTGTDGQIGAQYHWEGNKGKDLGYQEIKSIDPGKSIQMQCDIQRPFKAKPTFSYTFKQQGDKILVTQDFHLSVKRIDLFFMKLFGGVKDINRMNERGLELLKIACEK